MKTFRTYLRKACHSGGIWLWVALIVGASLRAAYLPALSHTPAFRFPEVDAGYHDAWARGLAFDNWETSSRFDVGAVRNMPFFRPPGYPYFLAFCYRLGGPSYFTPRIAQALLGLLSIFLAWRLGRNWAGPAVGGLWALLMAVHPGLIYFEGELLEPTLMITLGLLMMSAFARVAAHPRALGSCLLGGVLLGLQGLTRPNALLFAPLAALWVWLLQTGVHPRIPWTGLVKAPGRLRGHNRPEASSPTEGSGNRAIHLPDRMAWARVAVLTAGVLLAVLPATIRNRKSGGEWILVSTNGGINLYIGNNDHADGQFVATTDEFGAFGTSSVYEEIVTALSRREGRELGYREVDRYFVQRAMEWIRNNPGRALQLAGRKFLYMVNHRETGHNRSIYYDLRRLPVIRYLPRPFALLLAFAAGGLYLLLRHRQRNTGTAALRLAWLIGAFVMIYGFSFLPFFVTAQYRLPVEPWLAGAAAWTLVALARPLFERGYRSSTHPHGENSTKSSRMSFRQGNGAPLADPGFWIVVVATMTLSSVNWLGYEPNEAKWFFDQGVARAQMGDRVGAEKDYRLAMRANPKLPHPVHNLARLRMMAGDLDAAEKLFRKALSLGGKDRADLLTGYGNCLLRMRRIDDAITAYQAALEHEPSRLDAAFNLAEALLMRGEPAQAEAILEKIVTLDPKRTRARNRLLQVRARLREKKRREAGGKAGF